MLDSNIPPSEPSQALPEQYSEKTHPSPPSALKKGRLWLIGGILLLLGIGGGGVWYLNRQSSPQAEASNRQPPPTPVKLTTLTTETVESTTEVLGTLEASRTVELKPEIDGRINRIIVQDGDRVSQGQILFSLDSKDIEAELLQAKARLASEKAQLAELEAGSRSEDIAEAQASLEEAESRLRNAQQGARPEEIAQAQAAINSAEASAELAQQRVERYRNLQDEGAISADQFQEYVTESRSAVAELDRARRRLAELRQGRQSDIAGLSASVEQARQNLRRLENGPRQEVIAQARANVAEASANVATIEARLAKATIRAPIAGKLGNIPVKLGDYVEQGDQLTTITQNDVLELNLSIPIEKAPELRLGLPVDLLNAQNQPISRGRISFISPNVTADSQLILAKAVFPNADETLLNRQFIQAQVIWEQNRGILVPSVAISRIGGQAFVFVAKSADSDKSEQPQLVAEQRQITLGEMQGNNYQVVEGLQPGEKIVIAGILQLQNGTPIVVNSE